MARNGSGTYFLPPSNPVVSGTVIESDWANDTMSDLAAALSQSIAYDGQTVPIANLPMGGFHHTNVSDPVSRNQYASLGMVQDGRHQRVQIVSGVDNLVGTLVGGATAYVAGALVSFFAPATNTGVMTLNYNGIGARSIVSSTGLPLTAGQVQAGAFLMAIYDGTQFKLISSLTATVDVGVLTLATTGQERPGGGAYTPITIATGTSVNIPAGVAWIIPPDSDDPNDAVKVTWPDQTLTLTFLATSFTTTIAVNNFGQIVQFAGRTIGANLRSCAVLGVVEHITGVANRVVTKPTIFADDGYRNTDVCSLLTNTVISGGKVVPNGVSLLQLDISAGSIFMPGGDANAINSPNVYAIPQQANIQFKTLAGQNTVGVTISNAPVTQYDPNGAGVVTTIPNNNDTVVHRLYFLYGSYIWVYGQKIYANVEEAMSYLEWDRSQYKPSLFLMDATLIAEVIAIKNTTNLSTLTQCRIVSPGGLNFSIGSPGGISEAPIDGTPYGRQDAAWVQVLRRIGPTAINSFTVSGSPNVPLSLVQSPGAAGTLSFRHRRDLNDWFTVETTWPDDKTYFRSFNSVTNALRFTTTYDLASGRWFFPDKIDIGGTAGVGSTGVSANNDVARFQGTDGRVIVAGLKYQTSQTDTTAGSLLVVGAFGVGGSLSIPAGFDLNTLINSGFYRMIGHPVNGPSNAVIDDGLILVTRGLDTISQTIFSYTNGKSWTRAGSPSQVGGTGAYSNWNLNVSHGEAYLPNGTDLNTVKLSGYYHVVAGGLNQPTNSFGHLWVHGIDANTVTQIYTEAGGTILRTFQRICGGGVWRAWQPIFEDVGPALVTTNNAGGYSDAGSLRLHRVGKMVTLTGQIGRGSPMTSGDVIAFMEPQYYPASPAYGTAMILYTTGGGMQIANVLALSNGQFQLGVVATVLGAPAGTCSMGLDLTWFTS